jgi:hypothetical protein
MASGLLSGFSCFCLGIAESIITVPARSRFFQAMAGAETDRRFSGVLAAI